MTNAPSSLEKLKAQQAKLHARIQLMEARTKHAERKNDTRRKILVGSYYLDQAKQTNQLNDIKKLMQSYLKRNSDRKLFDLPDLPETKEMKNTKEAKTR
jgi:hypothetical protein